MSGRPPHIPNFVKIG